jgi:hypothetical protein
MAATPQKRSPTMSQHYDDRRENSGPGRLIAIVALLALLGLAAAWATGLFNIGTSGTLQAPKVSVQGGEVPAVEVETADIDVGTKTETVEVPTVTITKPDDDGSPRR